jgi:hypothetical protein
VYCGGSPAAEAALLKKAEKKSGQVAPAAAAGQPASPPGKAAATSASCSDITGTTSAAPAVTHCTDAHRALKAARVTRKEYPAYSADQYKKAAASARSANDTSLELTILREAASPRVADKSIDPPQRPDLREAFTYVTAAEAIEQNDATCAGLTMAADNYFAAGRIFLQSIKVGTPTEEAEKSYEFLKSNEMFRKRDALNELVDRARRENRCHAQISRPTSTARIPSGGGTTFHPPTNTADCSKILKDILPHAPNDGGKAWVKFHMDRSFCREDGTAMSAAEWREELKRRIDRMPDDLPSK